ncbi:MAG TPA: putative monovalent cation/H+ antiporter subunit A, partial [Candidatus Eisenbacteria bacterium]|nr:putative monovalent cation/H+ antiporter subunit A [Candidatus Eisenbacteria bacterium]
AGRASGWLFALLPAGLTVYFAAFIPAVSRGETFAASYAWVPALGVDLSFYLDGLSLLFALLISAIGALVLVYSGAYLGQGLKVGRFYVSMLAFMASMLGLVLADNLIVLFAFWELTSFSSYMLIGFDHERDRARFSALQALLVTGIGGLAMLAGFILLGMAAGTLEISALAARGDAIRSHPHYTAILALIAAGAFTKSAQTPFHFWLPNAMEAPTPVSAYLHSATMVKAGVYLLGRVSPALGGTLPWTVALTVAGGTTMLVGAFLALREQDLKRVLAYLTVSALGMLVLFIGMGTTGSVTAAIVFLIAHALYKGALFLVVGIIDHETGARDVACLSGLRSAMPITATAAFVAALSLAALPPSFGFVAKEMLLEASLAAGRAAPWLVAALVISGALFVAAAGLLAIQPFSGNRLPTPKQPHEGGPSLWFGPALLAGAGLVLGLVPGLIEKALVGRAVEAVRGAPGVVHLAAWHGFNLPLALSAVSAAAGVAMYIGRRKVRAIAGCWEVRAPRWAPRFWYGLALDALNWLADRQTRLLQNGYLRYYLLTIIVATVALVAPPVARSGVNFSIEWSDVRFHELALAALILAAATAAALTPSRLGAVAALGVAGYGIALVFVLFGAPDLAMTQFLIETLMVILFVLVFYFLPRFAKLSRPTTRVRDAAVAVASGALVTALTLIAVDTQLEAPISDYFGEVSVPRAHGRNIVNVILVDFRALDTLGEITVLAIAAIGVYSFLKLRQRQG